MKEIYYTLSSTRQSLFDLIDALRWISELACSECPFLAGHNLRVAYIAAHIGFLLELPPQHMSLLIKASLLHDIGFVFTRCLCLPEDLKGLEEICLAQHSETGAWMVKCLPFIGDAEEIAEIIRYHHINYKEGMESTIPPEAFIVKLANNIDLIQADHKNPLLYKREIAEEIRRLDIPPELKEAGVEFVLNSSYQMWFDLKQSEESQRDFLKDVGRWPEFVYNIDTLEEIGKALLRLVDFRSPITATHSTRVAVIAEHLSAIFDEPLYIQRLARIAGYMHDVGKMAVPLRILEKPARLTQQEYETIKAHVCYTHLFFKKANIRGRLTNMASFHHERIDGSGYPLGLGKEDLTIPERILQVADIAAALSEKRPYKPPLSGKEVLDTLKGEATRGKICKRIVNAFTCTFSHINQKVEEEVNQKTREFLTFMENLSSRMRDIEDLIHSKEMSYSL